MHASRISSGHRLAPTSLQILAALADLATHAYRSHDQRRALEAAVNAIRGFVAAAAYRESLIHAERAVLLWPQIEGAAVLAGMSHPDLLELAGQIASAANRPELATAMTQDALAELEVSAGDDRRLTLLTALYMYAWEAQDFDAAASAIEQANGLVDTAKTSRTTALVLHWIGWHRSWQGRNAEALRLLEAAMAMEEALGDRAAWTDSAACAASVLAESGAVDRGAMLVDASVTQVAGEDGRLGRLHADIDRGIVLTLAGRFDEALLVAGTGLATATRYGWEARLGPGFRACMADNYLELGRYDDLERVVAPVVAGGAIHHHVIWTRQVFARALVAQGRLDDAHRQSTGSSSTDLVGRPEPGTHCRSSKSPGPTAGWKTWPRASTMLRLVSRIASRSRPYRSCWRPASARVPTRPKSRGAATRPQTSPLPWTTPRDGRACSTLSSNASSRRAGWVPSWRHTAPQR